MDSNNHLEELLDELRRLSRDKRLYPFPIDDCRRLMPDGGAEYEDFVTYLDLYSIDMVGYCRLGKRILHWSVTQIQEAKKKLEKSFFEKYPQYKPFEPMITESDTPQLFTELMLYERMRTTLLKLLVLVPGQSGK